MPASRNPKAKQIENPVDQAFFHQVRRGRGEGGLSLLCLLPAWLLRQGPPTECPALDPCSSRQQAQQRSWWWDGKSTCCFLSVMELGGRDLQGHPPSPCTVQEIHKEHQRTVCQQEIKA